MNRSVVIAIPVYNEEDRIEATIRGIESVSYGESVVVINDGSTDSTLEKVKAMGIKYLDIGINQGKGYAMEKAISQLEYDVLVFLDGDLGETSSEVAKLIDPVLSGECDFTIAEFKSAKELTDIKGGFGLVKGSAKKGVKFFTGVEVNNSLSGQRAYSRESLTAIDYLPKNYGIEVAMTIQALNGGYKLLSVPVNMTHRFTARDLKGILHRAKQFRDIILTFIHMYFKAYRKVKKW